MEEAERRRLAEAIRDLANQLSRGAISDPDAITAALMALQPDPGGPSQFASEDLGSADHSLYGGWSGVFPPIEMHLRDGAMTGHVAFDVAWEGPPGMVHGGHLATGFDMMFSSFANEAIGPSVTRRLKLRYLRPTPLAAPLRYEIRLIRERARLIDLNGELYAADRLTMRAEAQLVRVDPARYRRSARIRGSGDGSGRPEDQRTVLAAETE